MTGKRPTPPKGFLSTSEAAARLGVSSAYVRKLLPEHADDVGVVDVRTEGGRVYRYVSEALVVTLGERPKQRRRDQAAVAAAGADGELVRDVGGRSEPTTAAKSQPGAAADAEVWVTPTPAGDGGTLSVAGSDARSWSDAHSRSELDRWDGWQLELELVSANTRVVELRERVAVLERLVGSLTEQLAQAERSHQREVRQLRNRLAELANSQMKLLEGHLNITAE